MRLVILAGGLGTRLSEETTVRPKPMVDIGGKPILWHIMRSYAAHGFKRFVVCCGYKADVIKDYFLNYHALNSDFTVRLGADEVAATKQAIGWPVDAEFLVPDEARAFFDALGAVTEPVNAHALTFDAFEALAGEAEDG